jgi:pyruvate formate-lyase activating enzyme-like uncharacterized protein
MKKLLLSLPLAITMILPGFKAVAAEVEEAMPMPAPGAGDGATKVEKLHHMLKMFKNMQMRKALNASGVDAATADKVMAALDDLKKEKGEKFKALKATFKDAKKQRLLEAGLDEAKADEVLANYKAEVKKVRHHMKEALKNLIKAKIDQRTSAE